tara:strand:- start:35056 stop:35259 length:204 start_codon:yes stop_codon:yes gene_type:complete
MYSSALYIFVIGYQPTYFINSAFKPISKKAGALDSVGGFNSKRSVSRVACVVGKVICGSIKLGIAID